MEDEDKLEEDWINWNEILDDESKTSQEIEKTFKKTKPKK